MVQLIVTDMDGTLLDDNKRLPLELANLLEELYHRDITFAVASGRSPIALKPLFGELADEMIFICDNGACVMYPHEAPILHNLSSDVIHHVLDLFHHDPNTVPVLCGFHHIYFPKEAGIEAFEEIKRYYFSFQSVPYQNLYAIDEPILKIALCNLMGTAKHVYPIMMQEFEKTHELSVSGKYWMDIMCKGITKGSAVAMLQERLGITAAETMSFGDYDNDISLLESAQYSYAMENAPKHVQQHAKFIAPSNNRNGVVHVICNTLGIHLENK